MAHYALRFISGKYQGGEFPIRTGREIVIGRSSELDMVLVEDMVSRKHAKITATDIELTIQDLGSTNGTFVNGEKIKKTRLKEGDRILIGTSIIRLVSVDGAGALSEVDAKKSLELAGQRRHSTGGGRPMQGVIEEIPLPDLLQLLSTSRKSGVLSIQGEALGRIYLRKGQIYFATINEAFDVPPRKALFRMLAWSQGTFELEPPDDKAVMEELSETTAALLVEAMRQLDEVRRIERDLPGRDTPLALSRPLERPLRDLGPLELDILQLSLNHGTLQGVLDASPHTDLETMSAVKKLVERDYLVAAE